MNPIRQTATVMVLTCVGAQAKLHTLAFLEGSAADLFLQSVQITSLSYKTARLYLPTICLTLGLEEYSFLALKGQT